MYTTESTEMSGGISLFMGIGTPFKLIFTVGLVVFVAALLLMSGGSGDDGGAPAPAPVAEQSLATCPAS